MLLATAPRGAFGRECWRGHGRVLGRQDSRLTTYVNQFVADGEWKHDHTGKTETDHEGNINNILYPTDIMETSAGAAMLSSVAPGAT